MEKIRSEMTTLKEELYRACQLNDREKLIRLKAEGSLSDVNKNLEIYQKQNLALENELESLREKLRKVEEDIFVKTETIEKYKEKIVQQDHKFKVQ